MCALLHEGLRLNGPGLGDRLQYFLHAQRSFSQNKHNKWDAGHLLRIGCPTREHVRSFWSESEVTSGWSLSATTRLCFRKDIVDRKQYRTDRQGAQAVACEGTRPVDDTPAAVWYIPNYSIAAESRSDLELDEDLNRPYKPFEVRRQRSAL